MPEENKENLSESTVQNGNPYDLVDHPQDAQVDQKESNTNPEKKESGQFFKKIIKSIAKVFGLSDPETGKPIKDSSVEEAKPEIKKEEVVSPDTTTLEQDVTAQEQQTKQEGENKKFSFENVMSGVTGVLDKIEKKVEEKTGLDFDAPLKKREERLNTEQQTTNNEEKQNLENESTQNDEE